MLDSGYIKLYRSLLKWEWYDDINTKVVFLHLLLTVNIDDSKWHGIEVKRGSRVSSYAKLAEETKLSVKQIRTAISHLETTGEVARYKYPKYTVFAVNNYDKYQQRASITASKGQSKGKVTASKGQQYKKVKEEKEEKEIYLLTSENQSENFSTVPTTPTFDEVADYIQEIGGGVDAHKFYSTYEQQGWKTKKGKPITDWKGAVRYWKSNEGKYKAKSASKDIPECKNADAYRSLVYNINE